LGDTALALGQHEAAMGVYRRLLAAAQTLRGDADAQTQQWKNRVMQLYQLMQQAQEEARRKQMQAQQEQMRRIQEQRVKEAEERAKKTADAKARKAKEDL